VKIRRKQQPTEERFQTGDRDGEGGPPETGSRHPDNRATMEKKSVASRRMSRGRGWQSNVGRTSDWKFRWGGSRKRALFKSIRKCTMLQPPQVYRPLRWPGKGQEMDREERDSERKRERRDR